MPRLSTGLNLALISTSDVPNQHYRCLPSLPQEMLPGQKHGGVEPATQKTSHAEPDIKTKWPGLQSSFWVTEAKENQIVL